MFKTRYFLIIIMLFAFVTSILLCNWQIDRYQYKKMIIKNSINSIDKPVDLSEYKCDISEDYKKFILDGINIINDSPIYYYVASGTDKKVKVMYPIFIMGKYYLIDLGLVIYDDIDFKNNISHLIFENVAVYSKFRKSEMSFIKNDYTKNLIYNLNWKQISDILNIELQPCILYVVEEIKELNNKFPNIIYNDIQGVKNIHGIYILFWALISLISLMFLLLFLFAKK